jgi:2-dehydro-3-deoxyphosphogluconate aldolase/(4S)-4-hydroxy-2-oxoglutarate aldolase
MSSKSRAVNQILESRIIAIVRATETRALEDAVSVLSEEGIDVVEVSFNTPNALSVIAGLSETVGDSVLLGAGTVLDAETAVAAIHAGARLIVAPTLNPDVIAACNRYGAVCVPGAFTPTEILKAYELGADFVKLFPAGSVGPGYLKAIRPVLPQVPIVPVGGVNVENSRAFIDAGAHALGIGSSLINTEILAESRFDELRERARKLLAAIS